jgi:hypothetical protein
MFILAHLFNAANNNISKARTSANWEINFDHITLVNDILIFHIAILSNTSIIVVIIL